VFIFAPGINQPGRVISGFANTKLASPFGIAVDDAGFVYVSNSANNTVTVYAPDARGDASPVRVIRGPNSSILDHPQFIAIGP
jgi:DNA-binding beta-propeller fold protein YncE